MVTDHLLKEPFFIDTDRGSAQKLLEGLEDGMFLVRASSVYFCTLTIKYKTAYYNIGIEQNANGMLKCMSKISNSPSFRIMQDLINYYKIHPVVVTDKETKKLLNILLRKCV